MAPHTICWIHHLDYIDSERWHHNTPSSKQEIKTDYMFREMAPPCVVVERTRRRIISGGGEEEGDEGGRGRRGEEEE